MSEQDDVNGRALEMEPDAEGAVEMYEDGIFTEELAKSAGEIAQAIQDADMVPPSIEDVKAGLDAMAGGVATAQDVENAARAEEGLPPKEPSLPLSFGGPFKADAALKAIFDKTVEITKLQLIYNERKEEAAEAKKDLDKAQTSLVNIIEALRQQSINPTLQDVSGCPWERDHPGQTCPICVEVRRVKMNPDAGSEAHPDHSGHAATAEAARVKNMLEPLTEALANVNLIATVSDLQGLSAEDLSALVSYSIEPSLIPPHVVTRCCVAAEPGTVVQQCKNCGRTLAAATDEEGFYNVDDLVGFECLGGTTQAVQDADAVPDPSADVEPTKKKKIKKGRTTPEAERAAQIDAAKQVNEPEVTDTPDQ
jgi:hypothetical protein